MIGIDIGGTNIRAGRIDRQFNLIRKETALTSNFRTAEELLACICRMVDRLNEDGQVNRIGMALPAPWKDGMERIMDITNIPCLENMRMADVAHYFPDYTLYFENDVNAAALLEAEHGSSRLHPTSMYITVSTGIGGGIVVNGRIHQGSHGYAGEIGGMIMARREGTSGAYETLESLCSGMALEETSKRCYGPQAAAVTLFDKYEQNDAQAISAVNQWVEHFSDAIATLKQTLDPGVFVVGGAVIEHNQWLLELAAERARDKVLEQLKDKIHVTLPTFGPDAGLIGAAYLAYINDRGA
ncbi:ROK family protein [Paenibacillus sp. LHD-117]|uniref:ROK family protein n=1 Tax=Paenibacillus sp. LHD-117 TaxID=3071412 RepID=UPI0027E0415A|nr:ROK family protein [Paenibacillus sp. LHD-117]MDQ6421474.1 ROK family protein [Paenibacillus sp. LHD-117]